MLARHDNGPGLLHVERVGRMLDRSLDEGFELIIRDRRLVAELVVTSSGLHRVSRPKRLGWS
jgi:hypothetical protein